MAAASGLDPNLTPALNPPPGIKSNLEDPHNIDPIIKFTFGICLGIGSLFALLRFYTRLFIIKAHGWEDYIMFVAWLGFIGYTATGLVISKFGVGIHQWDVSLSTFATFARLSYDIQVFYTVLICVIKISILIQYIHLFAPSRSGRMFWAIHVGIMAHLLFYIAVVLVQIMECFPREKIWEPSIPGTCVSSAAVLIVVAAINIVSDFSILILPIAKVWQLQLTRPRKWGISAVFAIGLLACASSIVRLIYCIKSIYTADLTYELTTVYLWTLAEICSGILCGCLPVTPAFFRYYIPRVKSNLSATYRELRRGHSSGNTKSSKPGEWDPHGSFVELTYARLANGRNTGAQPNQIVTITADAAGAVRHSGDVEQFAGTGICKTTHIECSDDG